MHVTRPPDSPVICSMCAVQGVTYLNLLQIDTNGDRVVFEVAELTSLFKRRIYLKRE